MSGPDPRTPTDEELVRAAQADRDGELGRSAASELFGRYQRRVYLWCLRIVRDREHALDLAQDVLTRAWLALPGFERRSKFSSWLFVIARRRCLDAVATPSWKRDEEVEPDDVQAPAGGPEEQLQREAGETALLALLERHLDDVERAALWMRCVEKLPLDNLERALRLEPGSGARVLLQRARRKLRRALDARAREDS